MTIKARARHPQYWNMPPFLQQLDDEHEHLIYRTTGMMPGHVSDLGKTLLDIAHRYSSPDPFKIIRRGDAQHAALWGYYIFRNPLSVLSVDGWLSLFESVGLMEGVGAGDSAPVRLYRGANRQAPHGLSWTPDLDIAAYYAGEVSNPSIFEMVVPRSYFIHAVHWRGGELSEVIVDSRRHEVRPHTSTPRTPTGQRVDS